MAIDTQDDFLHGGPSRFESASGGVLRIVLLFGSAIVALALFATMALDASFGDYTADAGYGLDTTATGSVRYSGTYVVRKSVLQSSPDAVCILRDNGTRSGDC